MTLLNAQQLDRISSAVTDLTPAQLAWVGGYLSGMSLGRDNVIPFPQVATHAPAPQAANSASTTILFGSQTGNGKKIAEKLQQTLNASGISTTLKSLRDYRPQQLKKEQRVVFVVSTHGNGEPPDDARSFFQFITSPRAPQLADLEFAVLALGDSSYDEFCQTGIELDQRLEALGAKRWLARVDCDVDFADDAAGWQQQVAEKLQAENAPATGFRPHAVSTAVRQAVVGTAESPYAAELLALTPVTDPASDKEVLHLEFSLEDSGIQYQPGDIFAVQVKNDAALVDAILQHLQWAGDTLVTLKGKAIELRTALLEKLEITSLTRKQWSDFTSEEQKKPHPNPPLLRGGSSIPLTSTVAGESLVSSPDKGVSLDHDADADLLDVLQSGITVADAQALIDLLRPLQAREYSIASSQAAHGEEVHLLVKRVAYAHRGRVHQGAGSNWLARLQAGEQAQIYIKPNERFKLPQDDSTKIIMIGAGTGVAPFRSFLFEREARGAQGNSWLFFGEQHFRTDFLYQAEWLEHIRNGTLERMDVAFSRDQAEKIYVQHRLLAQAADLWQWLQDGAHLYVCGDMHKMAKDVHTALIQIITEQGGKTPEQAEAALEQLIHSGRYQRDVY